jgi:hypothetical protein
MSDLGVTKHMDGCAAKFLRFAGPDNLIIEVNGTEQTVTREFWRAIPILENKQDSKTVDGNIGVAHSPFGRDQV